MLVQWQVFGDSDRFDCIVLIQLILSICIWPQQIYTVGWLSPVKTMSINPSVLQHCRLGAKNGISHP